MPRATINVEATTRFELKSLPAKGGDDGGFVELKKMAYGQILERRDMGAKLAIEGLSDNRQDDLIVTTEMIQQKVTEYEFKHSIVSHNLEDEHGTLLNFSNTNSVMALDPQVGQEIDDLITELNTWDVDLQGKDEPASETELEPA